ncbi:MAG: tyrosine-protein phosphatase [Bosea sp. (in: a-proteobacteria)]
MTVIETVDVATSKIAAPSISNFRDVGGHALPSGKLRTGRLYRSAAPRHLTASDTEAFGIMRLTTIVDLRGRDEAAKSPTLGHDLSSVRIVSTPIEPRSSGRVQQALADGSASAALMRDLMISSYRHYVTEAAPAFGDALTALLTSDDPALVHCTAGKDRTGFVVAVIQSALGASENDIATDYLRTNTDWDRASVSSHLPLDSDIVAPILRAEIEYLSAAFEEITRHDGNVHGFIERATQGRVTRAHLDVLLHQVD